MPQPAACGAPLPPASPTTTAPGLASLGLEYDAQQNPAIFDQLLAQTPAALIARGEPILEQQRRQVAAAVATAFEVALGGGAGAARGWGRCLAVRVGADLAGLRSQLGNALAEESAARGLRPMAVVAYIEVRFPLACPSADTQPGLRSPQQQGRRRTAADRAHPSPPLIPARSPAPTPPPPLRRRP